MNSGETSQSQEEDAWTSVGACEELIEPSLSVRILPMASGAKTVSDPFLWHDGCPPRRSPPGACIIACCPPALDCPDRFPRAKLRTDTHREQIQDAIPAESCRPKRCGRCRQNISSNNPRPTRVSRPILYRFLDCSTQAGRRFPVDASDRERLPPNSGVLVGQRPTRGSVTALQTIARPERPASRPTGGRCEVIVQTQRRQEGDQS